MGFWAPLWRGLAVFRTASLLYAVGLVGHFHEELARPWVAWGVLAVMAVWTALSSYAYVRQGRTDWALLLTDLAIAFGCLFATALAVTPDYLLLAPPLTATWFGGAALSVAVVGGRRWALSVALGYGVADLLVRVAMDAEITSATARGIVLLVLAGFAVGYMAHQMAEAERRFTRAVEMEARTRERERLARSIHDSVLQVLAMVQRRGVEVGGEAAELGRLAGEQEEKLRGLIGAQDRDPEGPEPALGPMDPDGDDGAVHPDGTADTIDVTALLRGYAAAGVTVSAPAVSVPLPSRTAREVDSAVRAALANVERHCPEGTGVWLLVEDEGRDGGVIVTVRDDGPGMPEDRIAQAAAEGRLGVAQSIRGRIGELGGETTVITAPGEGTEIEMRVPRPRA